MARRALAHLGMILFVSVDNFYGLFIDLREYFERDMYYTEIVVLGKISRIEIDFELME